MVFRIVQPGEPGNEVGDLLGTATRCSKNGLNCGAAVRRHAGIVLRVAAFTVCEGDDATRQVRG